MVFCCFKWVTFWILTAFSWLMVDHGFVKHPQLGTVPGQLQDILATCWFPGIFVQLADFIIHGLKADFGWRGLFANVLGPHLQAVGLEVGILQCQKLLQLIVVVPTGGSLEKKTCFFWDRPQGINSAIKLFLSDGTCQRHPSTALLATLSVVPGSKIPSPLWSAARLISWSMCCMTHILSWTMRQSPASSSWNVST